MKDQPILAYLLATLFIGLKLTGQIEWPWLWVLAPLWVYVIATPVVGVVIGVIGGLHKRRVKTRFK